jgi:thiol-disulfide isomerase/thioredoxin
VPDAISFGPIMLSLDRFVAIALIWAFLAGASWLLKRELRAAQSAPWLAVLAGIVGARAAYVAAHWDAFRVDPLAIIQIWQGGFFPLTGMVCAAGTLALLLRNGRPLWRSVALLAAVGLLWQGYDAAKEARPRPPFPQGIRVTTLGGAPLDLDALQYRPFVVNLWATWCAPCRREMPMLIDVAAKTPNIPILLVNQGEHADLIRRYLEAERLSERSIFSDRGAALMRAAGAQGLPATLFIGADGRIRDIHLGELSRAGLVAGITALESEP